MKVRLRIYLGIGILIISVFLAYWQWDPGQVKLDRNDYFQQNGLWLGHGWIGGEDWFTKYAKKTADFDAAHLAAMSRKVSDLKIRYLFPHLCPANAMGVIPGIDQRKLVQLKAEFKQALILPWIGGSTESTVDVASAQWNDGFVDSIRELLRNESIDGIHLNIEPMTSGDEHFLVLLRRIKAIKGNKILSLAAYPPPTIFHPHPSVHWDLTYYGKISLIVDQLVPMMYDTALTYRKVYTHLLKSWTDEIITNSNGKNNLFGIPVYDDRGVGYHDPDIENISTSIPGVIAGVNVLRPPNSIGLSFYCEWELDTDEVREIAGYLPK